MEVRESEALPTRNHILGPVDFSFWRRWKKNVMKNQDIKLFKLHRKREWSGRVPRRSILQSWFH